MTTADLDALAEREIRAAGAVPAFKGYKGYPASICASVNEQVVHGIPSSAHVLPTNWRNQRLRRAHLGYAGITFSMASAAFRSA